MQGLSATTMHRVKRKRRKVSKGHRKLFRKSQKEKVYIKFTLKAARQRKAFYRQRIAESSCARH